MSAIVNKSTKLFQLNIFKFITENITLENGVTTDVHIVRHPGASAIVPFVDQKTLLMVRQYRHATGGYIWEIPAGTIELNETPWECAKRELIEEAGYFSDNLHKLGKIFSVPGYSDEQVHIFLAEDIKPAKQNLDKDELLTVHTIKFEDALEMIYKGDICDGKTIAALFLAKKWIKNKSHAL